MKQTLAMIDQMKKDGVIRNYAIGGAVGATFYLEPFSTIDIDVFVVLKLPPSSLQGRRIKKIDQEARQVRQFDTVLLCRCV